MAPLENNCQIPNETCQKRKISFNEKVEVLNGENAIEMDSLKPCDITYNEDIKNMWRKMMKSALSLKKCSECDDTFSDDTENIDENLPKKSDQNEKKSNNDIDTTNIDENSDINGKVTINQFSTKLKKLSIKFQQFEETSDFDNFKSSSCNFVFLRSNFITNTDNIPNL